MAMGDVLEKLVLFWEWVSKGLLGWNKGAGTLGSSAVRQLHAALQGKYRAAHIEAAEAPPVDWLEDCPEYAAAKKLAAVEAVPDRATAPTATPRRARWTTRCRTSRWRG